MVTRLSHAAIRISMRDWKSCRLSCVLILSDTIFGCVCGTVISQISSEASTSVTRQSIGTRVRAKLLILTRAHSLCLVRTVRRKCLSPSDNCICSRDCSGWWAGFGFDCEAGSIFNIGRPPDQISALDTLAFDCLEHRSHRFRRRVSNNVARVEFAGCWPRSDWQRSAQTSERKSV